MKKLIGIAGYARSGKDTFFARSAKYLNDNGFEAKRYAFADALKSEVDSLLTEHTGLSAFTEKDSEKEIVRPLLVTYGTEIRRKLSVMGEKLKIEEVEEMISRVDQDGDKKINYEEFKKMMTE